MADVLIIGAGVAGLAAANLLRKNGNFNVTILEADNRIGGRVQTLQLGEHFIENGAQSVHGEKFNSVFMKAEPLGLVDPVGSNLQYFADSVFLTENGTALSTDNHSKAIKIVDIILDGPDEDRCKNFESLGDWAKSTFHNLLNDSEQDNLDEKLAQNVFEWMHKTQTTADAADSWYTESCKGQLEFWSCDGNSEVQWKSPASYSSFLNLLLYDKPSFAPQFTPEIPDWIHLGKEVVTVDSQPDKVNVICKDGARYLADHVISTVSLGVLKEKAETMFIPHLPERKLNAIKNLEIGVVDKLHFEFESKWWPDDIVGFNLLWDSDYQQGSNTGEDALKADIDGIPVWCRSIIGFYTVGSHPTTLNSWIAGPSARFMEKLPENEVKDAFVKVLRKFVGHLHEVPDPINFRRSTWDSNPFTRGSYSHRGVKSDINDAWASDIGDPILSPEQKPKVCFAGEASHEHFYATVHGAHDSGVREATRLINFYQGQGEVSSMCPYTLDMFENGHLSEQLP